MFNCIVSLAGVYGDSKGVRRLSALSDLVVAADGGADMLLKTGIEPDWVIGDDDSAEMSLPEKTIQLLFSEDKNYTDGELAIALALYLAESKSVIETKDSLLKAIYTADDAAADSDISNEYLAKIMTANFRQPKDRTGLSFLILFPFGKRVDHSWTNVLLAASLARSGAKVYLSDGLTLARIIAGKLPFQPAFAPETLAGSTILEQSPLAFSAMPLDDKVRGFTLKGLQWELDQAELAYNRAAAVSNRPCKTGKVNPYVSLDQGTVMLLFTTAD
ncbi:MAG: hypothetical protein GX777_03405 [Fastidiosipila sp.]|nr:hypothetical protein [Fastidiosipila sp.]